MRQKMRLLTTIIIIALILTAGCEEKKNPSGRGASQVQVFIRPDVAEGVKRTAETVTGVEESTAVVVNNEISAGIKVKGLNRLRLKQIKEEVHKKISRLNTGYNVHVTSDKKLFSQLRRIEDSIKDGRRGNPSDILNQVKKINNDMKG